MLHDLNVSRRADRHGREERDGGFLAMQTTSFSRYVLSSAECSGQRLIGSVERDTD
jgi:hypothetical protein